MANFIAMFSSLLLLLTQVLAKDLLFDICAEVVTNAQYRCYRQAYDDFSMWMFWSEKGIESLSQQNFRNAKNADLKVHVGYTPCRAKKPDVEVQQILNYFGTDLQAIWIEPGKITSKICNWQLFPKDQNCDYLKDILHMMKQNGLKGGIITTRQLWMAILGSVDACPQLSQYPLVWIPTSEDEQNGQPNFELYSQIGGWKKPYMKLYNIETVCGRQYYKLYYQD